MGRQNRVTGNLGLLRLRIGILWRPSRMSLPRMPIPSSCILNPKAFQWPLITRAHAEPRAKSQLEALI